MLAWTSEQIARTKASKSLTPIALIQFSEVASAATASVTSLLIYWIKASSLSTNITS